VSRPALELNLRPSLYLRWWYIALHGGALLLLILLAKGMSWFGFLLVVCLWGLSAWRCCWQLKRQEQVTLLMVESGSYTFTAGERHLSATLKGRPFVAPSIIMLRFRLLPAFDGSGKLNLILLPDALSVDGHRRFRAYLASA